MKKRYFKIEDGKLSAEAMDELKSRLQSAELTFHNGVALPPWEAIPSYDRSSMVWRMGNGEDIMGLFYDWYRSLPAQKQNDYMSQYPPPAGWESFFEQITK